MGISRATYYRWRKRLKEEGLAGLKPRSRRPHAFTRAGHDLRLEVGLSWRATQEVSLEGAVGLSLLLLGEERVREGRREASWWGEGGWGLQVGAAYRLRELPGRPRVYLGARYREAWV